MSFFCSESNRKELKAMAKLGRNFQSDSICSNQNGNEKRRWKWRWRWPRRREHGSHGAPCLTSSSVSAAWAIITEWKKDTLICFLGACFSMAC